MAAGQPLTFSPITVEQFAALTAKAQAAGIAIEGDAGSAKKFGVQVSWNYTPATEELTLQCVNAPFYVTPDQINQKIQALVKETLA